MRINDSPLNIHNKHNTHKLAIIKAGICGLLAIPAFFIFPLITPVIIALAFAMYFKEAKGIQSRIKNRREAIEYELSRFVIFIAFSKVRQQEQSSCSLCPVRTDNPRFRLIYPG